MIVEAQEFNNYALVVNREKLLILDKSYQDDYDTCDLLGTTKSKGPGAARNFAWDHAVKLGSDWHWVMDDNIRDFYRLHRNFKIRLDRGIGFRCMEDFCLRYENVVMGGPNYQYLAKRKEILPPVVFNTRIYSCNLIRNDIPFRWRARYNEDTDLSLRILKAGWVTVQFNAFLQDKATTQSIKGGCDKDFYSVEGTLAKSEMQVKLHPDVSRLVWKFNRWHHHVDYRPFKKNKLIRKAGIQIPNEPNEYGMKLTSIAVNA